MSLTAAKAYDYVFSTVSIYSEDISGPFSAACVRFVLSLFNIIMASLLILAYTLILMLKLIIMVFPHFISTIQSIIDFHRSKLSSFDIFVEFSVIFVISLLLIFRKRIINQWKIFEKSVAKKSKVRVTSAMVRISLNTNPKSNPKPNVHPKPKLNRQLLKQHPMWLSSYLL
jgi:hypothetical protein